MWYVRDRMDGIEARDWSQSEEPLLKGRDRDQFPGFYAWADANASLFGYMEDSYFWSSNATQPVVTLSGREPGSPASSPTPRSST